MRMRAHFLLVLLLSIAFTMVVNAQGKGGGGGNGHKPPAEVTTSLSYPAFFFGYSQQSGTIGTYTLAGSESAGMSYGCGIPETIGTTTYPNKSCINTDGTFQNYTTCQVTCGNATVEPIYWEKNLNNRWQAGYDITEGSDPLPVSYIDWGDNLESKTWPVQVLRVETNTFSALPAYDSTVVKKLEDNPGVRFDMWHVSGQGTDELWGVHATDAGIPYVFFTNDINGLLVPYWPYAVDYSSTARLNIAKLQKEPGSCPVTATGVTQSPFQGTNNRAWDPTAKAWTGAAYTNDMAYVAELNIKGSYVYGYNWNIGSEPVPGDVNKAGWWRLTFYDQDKSITFDTWQDPATAGTNTLAPPALLDATVGPIPDGTPSPSSDSSGLQARTRLRQQATVGDILPAAETGAMLYVPQVDVGNQLTYIDICISASKGGGSGNGKNR